METLRILLTSLILTRILMYTRLIGSQIKLFGQWMVLSDVLRPVHQHGTPPLDYTITRKRHPGYKYPSGLVELLTKRQEPLLGLVGQLIGIVPIFNLRVTITWRFLRLPWNVMLHLLARPPKETGLYHMCTMNRLLHS
jgi:hypothetical protein